MEFRNWIALVTLIIGWFSVYKPHKVRACFGYAFRLMVICRSKWFALAKQLVKANK